jgi:MFS family permease
VQGPPRQLLLSLAARVLGLGAPVSMQVLSCKSLNITYPITGALAYTNQTSILAAYLPLERRPIFVSSFSGMYGIAAVVASILGGYFTTNLTWRWYFYINFPIGGSAILAIVTVLPSTT